MFLRVLKKISNNFLQGKTSTTPTRSTCVRSVDRAAHFSRWRTCLVGHGYPESLTRLPALAARAKPAVIPENSPNKG